MRKELIAIKQVLSKKNYLILFLISSSFIFLIFYFLTLWTVTDKSPRIFIEMNGYTYSFFTFLLLAVIALLLGVYIPLFVYKFRLIKGKKLISLAGISGFVTGLLSSGCPMCGSVIFALLGMPLALFFLPFKGLELRILAVIILIFSVYFLARSLNECKVIKNK